MRKLAREVAVCLVYESIFNSCFNIDQLMVDNYFVEFDLVDDDKDFVLKIVENYIKNSDEINKNINDRLINFAPDRILKIDRAIMAVAITEIVYLKDLSHNIIINEAVEIAKKYSNEKSPKFINGLLANIVKEQK